VVGGILTNIRCPPNTLKNLGTPWEHDENMVGTKKGVGRGKKLIPSHP
jgi:hypothetical protein